MVMQQLRNPYIMKWGMWVILGITIPSFVLFYGFGNKGQHNSMEMGTLVTMQTKDGEVKLGREDLRVARDSYVEDIAATAMSQQPQANAQMYNRVRNIVDRAISNRDVADYAVSQVALRERLNKQDIRVTDTQVSRLLQSEGFTKESLKNYLQRARISEDQFSLQRRADLEEKLAAGTVSRLARTSLLELYNEYLNYKETLTAAVVRIPVQPDSAYTPTEEQIAARYKELLDKKDRLTIQGEQRVYRFVKLEVPQAPRPAPTDEQLREAYDKSAADDADLQTPSQIRVRHLLIAAAPDADEVTRGAAKDKAAKARERILAGEDFAKVADEVSEDPANKQVVEGAAAPTLLGGYLPTSLKGDEVDGWGEQWIKFINESDLKSVSEVIETPKGYSVARVESRQDPGKMTFEQAKELLRARVRVELAQKAAEARNAVVEEKLKALRDAEAMESTLDGISRTVKSDVKTSSPTLSADSFIAGVGNLISEAEALRNLKEKQRTPVLQTGTGDPIILEVAQVIPQRTKSLDEIKTVLASQIRQKAAGETAKGTIDQLKARVTAGDSLTTAATSMSLAASTLEPFTRINLPVELRTANNPDFSIATAKQGDLLVFTRGPEDIPVEFVVVHVEKINTPKLEEFVKDLRSVEGAMLGLKRISYIEEFRRDAVRTAKLTYNPDFISEEATPKKPRKKGQADGG